MAIRPLIQLTREQFEDKATSLRRPCVTVTDFGDEFQSNLSDLIDTFKSHKIAVGLAAPQIGIGIRVTVINLKRDKAEPTLVIVNPRILSTGRKSATKPESCMSLPHFQGPVERSTKVVVGYQDRTGKYLTLGADGFLARVLFHELDHLDGILYVDRMDDLSKLEPVEFFKDD